MINLASQGVMTHHWHWVYFHGLEPWVTENSGEIVADLVSSDSPMPDKKGVYEVNVYGKICTLYMWQRKRWHGHPMTGLIVDPDDADMVEDAKTKYENEANFL